MRPGIGIVTDGETIHARPSIPRRRSSTRTDEEVGHVASESPSEGHHPFHAYEAEACGRHAVRSDSNDTPNE